MRQYVDLHIKPPTAEVAREMENVAQEMGFRAAALTLSKFEKTQGANLSLATRIDLDVRGQKELLDALSRSRRRYDVVAVRCLTKEVARQAAKDRRVDILQFPEDPALRKQNWLDMHEAKLAEATGCAYEINASELLATSPSRLAKVITQIKRDLNNAIRHNIPMVLSSGAVSPLSMREPKALTALASLLDIEEDYAADMISTIPSALLESNRRKQIEEEQ